ncbi:Peptidyl-prolyl cis-trans isomerase cyp18 [Roseimaritima multifibrata]|uniref:Peptidyl-prolyl cis-trans isomerase n=1 Tax=Roseimaritima multifibrata TaxID=1930274 RepID=A0A517MP33_9BACT|nr:peptidylprolyl isomerase [Roseimaritima multifibrata]QDS96639.1 Peptidyl-prolyl cis-trans isomerase cyp18 [Roseimaritima multifibrata]
MNQMFRSQMLGGRVLFASLAFVAASVVTVSAAEPVRVELDTTLGKIELELDADKAPQTVANFVQYVKDGHYNGTIFHRVIPQFMIQGGGMVAGLTEKPTRAPVKNESANGLKNLPYTVAMARTPAPDSATSQFFINLADNDFLNRENARDGAGYAVFGKVVAGKEVVDKIAGVKTVTKAPHANVPEKDVVLKTAKLIEK